MVEIANLILPTSFEAGKEESEVEGYFITTRAGDVIVETSYTDDLVVFAYLIRRGSDLAKNK